MTLMLNRSIWLWKDHRCGGQQGSIWLASFAIMKRGFVTGVKKFLFQSRFLSAKLWGACAVAGSALFHLWHLWHFSGTRALLQSARSIVRELQRVSMKLRPGTKMRKGCSKVRSGGKPWWCLLGRGGWMLRCGPGLPCSWGSHPPPASQPVAQASSILFISSGNFIELFSSNINSKITLICQVKNEAKPSICPSPVAWKGWGQDWNPSAHHCRWAPFPPLTGWICETVRCAETSPSSRQAHQGCRKLGGPLEAQHSSVACHPGRLQPNLLLFCQSLVLRRWPQFFYFCA